MIFGFFETWQQAAKKSLNLSWHSMMKGFMHSRWGDSFPNPFLEAAYCRIWDTTTLIK